MSIKKTSEYKKLEFEYESPDRDILKITFVDTEDRQYVEIEQKGSGDKRTYDFDALCEIVDECRAIANKVSSTINSFLESPTITDHRSTDELSPSDIQSNISDSMSKYEDSTFPIENLNETSEVVVSSTENDEWKKEAENRQSNPFVVDNQKKLKKKHRANIPKANKMI